MKHVEICGRCRCGERNKFELIQERPGMEMAFRCRACSSVFKDGETSAWGCPIVIISLIVEDDQVILERPQLADFDPRLQTRQWFMEVLERAYELQIVHMPDADYLQMSGMPFCRIPFDHLGVVLCHEKWTRPHEVRDYFVRVASCARGLILGIMYELAERQGQVEAEAGESVGTGYLRFSGSHTWVN